MEVLFHILKYYLFPNLEFGKYNVVDKVNCIYILKIMVIIFYQHNVLPK